MLSTTTLGTYIHAPAVTANTGTQTMHNRPVYAY